MTLLPVIERELRAQSRLSFTYGLRMMGVALLLLAAFYFGLNHGFTHHQGGRLFGYLNVTLFCSIWALVPPLVADCISHEKREGTLGLLFLTPLRAGDIVLAKGLVHGLRALTLWLAVLPVLMIPVLLGGVTWKEAVLSVLANFSSICWALAAGLLASATGKQWLRSVVFAYVLAALFLVGFFFLNGLSVMNPASAAPRYWFLIVDPSGADRSQQIFQAGFIAATDVAGLWGQMLAMIPMASQWTWLKGALGVAALSLLALLIATGIAARSVRMSWRERPRRSWELWLEAKFCTPIILVSFLRRWMRRKLERNPIGWLEQRTWSGRLVTWGWFAVMVSLYSFALTGASIGRALGALQQFMAQLLIGSLAVSAAGSFRRERETGVLELLLVSPLREGQIIGGRLRGLWGQFLPALVVLVAIWLYVSSIFPTGQDLERIWFYLSSFVTLPVIGLYFSLRRNNFMNAFVFTLLTGLLAPIGLHEILTYGIDAKLPGLFPSLTPQSSMTTFEDLLWLARSSWTVEIFQFLFAAWAGRQLYRDLARREFASGQTSPSA